MATDSGDYCMQACSKSQVCLLRPEVDMGLALTESEFWTEMEIMCIKDV